MRVTARVAIVAAALTTGGGALQHAVAEAPAQLCEAILVSSAEETPGSSGERFSASKTADLTFQVMLSGSLSGDHVLELRVFTPRKFLYRSIAVPVSLATGTTGKAGKRERRIEGYPNPQRVRDGQTAKYQNKDVQKVEIGFPVGGTDVTTNSLYGKWEVQAFLDGSDIACGRATSFKITQ
jgi:hypothetical protein